VIKYILAGWIVILSLFHLIVVVLKKPINIERALLPLFNTNNLQVMVFLLAIIFSVVTISSTASGCCGRATWFLGLFTTLLGWINLIYILSKMLLIGEYAIVYLDIILTFMKLILFALPLVLAATVILTMTFFDAQAIVSSCTVIIAIMFVLFYRSTLHSIHLEEEWLQL
jgi:hypothetical protein